MDTPDPTPQRHADQLAHLEAVQARLDQSTAHRDSRPPLDPQDYETTIARVRRMAERETHPTWFQAAYADLAQRLTRVEDRLESLEDSMSLLHTKMEMLIGQLAAAERQQAHGRDA